MLEGETPDILTLFHRPANLVSRSLIQNETDQTIIFPNRQQNKTAQ